MSIQLQSPFTKELFDFLILFHQKIVKPFESSLKEHLSPIQTYSLGILRSHGTMTMTELANKMTMSKQQMTKIINRLFEMGFIERIYDQTDRRIIKIVTTQKSDNFFHEYQKKDIESINCIITKLDKQDADDFKHAVAIMTRVLSKLPDER